MLKESLVHFTKYNLWANQIVIGFMNEAGEEACRKKQVSSFPTIFDTMMHIWDAQKVWMDRLNGIPLKTWPSEHFKGDFQESCGGFLRNSKEFIALTESYPESDLKQELNYKSFAGKDFSNSIGHIILHCMNHSTYHRGQIVTMLRNVGFTKLASTDYISFCRQE